MNKAPAAVAAHLGGYLALALLSVVPVVFLYLDVAWLGDGVGEVSLTEMAQTLVLLCCVATFLVVARQRPDERGFAVLAAAFFLCMVIREQNNALKAVAGGLWEGMVLVVAVAGIGYAALHGRRAMTALARFSGTRAGGMMMVGLVLLVVYSRLFGAGAVWHAMLDGSYARVAKNAAEEGSELCAYMVILAASQSYRRQFHRFFAKRAGARDERDRVVQAETPLSRRTLGRAACVAGGSQRGADSGSGMRACGP